MYCIKNKDVITEKHGSSRFRAKGRKLNYGNYKLVNNATCESFMNIGKRDVPVGGYIIREKASN